MTFFFKNSDKDNIMTEKMKKLIEIIIFADFVKKILHPIKLEIIVI